MKIATITAIAVPAATVLGVGVAVYQQINRRGRLKISLGIGHGINLDGEGTYLALVIAISNVGHSSMFFNCLKAIRSDGSFFYPSFNVKGGIKIEPRNSITGQVPSGQVLHQNVTDLLVLDGVWKAYAVSRSELKRSLESLADEANRLKGLRVSIS